MIPPGAGDPASAQAAPAPQEGSAQAPATPPAAPGQGDPGQAAPVDPSAFVPADPAGQQLDGADAQDGPRAKGTQADANEAATDQDPESEVPSSPEEQKQYDSLVARFLLFISDPRQSTPDHPSPTQSVLGMLNKPNVPAAIALGKACANIVMMLMHSARVQGKPYDAEVVFHAADEMIPALYLLGAAHGVWKGLPPFHGMQPDGSYEFADDEIKVLGEAKMQGTRFLGNLLVQSGQITNDVAQSNAELWKQRIAQEVAHGNVSDEVMEQLAKKGVFDKLHDHLGTAGYSGADQQAGAGAPAPAPMPAPTASAPGLIPDSSQEGS